MDIYSKNKYPANALSNFAPHNFIFDGVEISGMEGFIQSLKYKNPDMQKHVCTLFGITAKRKGHNKKWYKKQEVYWNGKTYPRQSKEYNKLIHSAYIAMTTQNKKFQRALKASKNANFTHSIGKKSKSHTMLTKEEFTHELTSMRDLLYSGKIKDISEKE